MSVTEAGIDEYLAKEGAGKADGTTAVQLHVHRLATDIAAAHPGISTADLVAGVAHARGRARPAPPWKPDGPISFRDRLIEVQLWIPKVRSVMTVAKQASAIQ